MTMPIMQVSNVRFEWSRDDEFSLNIPDFSIDPGETVLLLGDSGSGKSTLLSVLCGTALPDSGHVTLGGQDITKLSASARDKLRGEKIGVIFQQFNLLPFGTVLDNITLPLQFAPSRKGRVSDPKAAAETLIKELQLPAEILTKKANQLSVGQQQRVAAARALIGYPSLIVADEPTSALDADSQAAFMKLLFDQVRSHDTAMLMVSHNPDLGEYFDRVVTIDQISGIEGDAK